MPEVVVSAPGKILWLGGYAVLERPNTSFVTGVDKRVYARVTPSEKLRFVSKQFDFDTTSRFENGRVVLDAKTPPAKFVVSAAQITLAYLQAKGKPLQAFTLETVSDPAFGVKDKAGLGSSAAVTTAAVAAILELHGVSSSSNRDLVFKLAQWAHADAQGGNVGSGFDIAAAAFGASTYVRFSPTFITEHPFAASIDEKWDYQTSDVPLPGEFRIVIANILGQSASTSEMVKKVNAWKAGAPDEYKTLLTRLNEANKAAIKALGAYSHSGNAENLDAFKHAFRVGRALTRELGEKSGAPIETPVLMELVDACERNGAFVAKLPGAGGGDSVAAFCRSEADEKKLRSFLTSYDKVPVKPLDLKASNEGLRLETAEKFEEMQRHANAGA